MPALDRDAVGAASACNWCAFILLLFATCSPWWSWGYYYGATPIPPYGYAETSIGPWIAGFVWTYIPYYYCYGCVYSVSSAYVYWTGITAEQACPGANSTASINLWSGPTGLNLCNYEGSTPSFTVPSTVSGIQACIIIATIFCFFAAVLGCVDAGSSGARKAAAPAACFSCVAAIFALAAFCAWAGFNFVNNLQYTSGGWYMPVYYDHSPLQLAAIKTDMWWGPGFATSITAFILQFFATMIHIAAIGGTKSEYDEDQVPVFKPAAAEPNLTPAVPAPIEPVVEAKPVVSV